MQLIVKRYKVKPEKAREHEREAASVFLELQAKSPAGLRCLVLKIGDGSYIHIAVIEDGAPLDGALESFGLFRVTILERCSERPLPSDVSIFRQYRMLE